MSEQQMERRKPSPWLPIGISVLALLIATGALGLSAKTYFRASAELVVEIGDAYSISFDNECLVWSQKHSIVNTGQVGLYGKSVDLQLEETVGNQMRLSYVLIGLDAIRTSEGNFFFPPNTSSFLTYDYILCRDQKIPVEAFEAILLSDEGNFEFDDVLPEFFENSVSYTLGSATTPSIFSQISVATPDGLIFRSKRMATRFSGLVEKLPPK